jgi:hypothetical protein
MNRPAAPTRDATIEKILEASDRPTQTLPIWDTFVQGREDGKPVPGPLASLVHRGRDLTIEQYLLAHAWASGGEFDLLKHPRVWTTALGLSDDLAGRRVVQRNWSALDEMKLIRKERSGRLLKITLLADDGSGRPYKHPGAGRKKEREDYFQLPYAYWSSGFYSGLKVPGKAVLLIAMTLGDWFWLPSRLATAWYGISASTIERGLRELRRADILDARWIWKEQFLAPEPYAREYYYRLKKPFGPRGWYAKGAPPEWKASEPAKPSPSRQGGRPRRRSKRRKPAATTT